MSRCRLNFSRLRLGQGVVVRGLALDGERLRRQSCQGHLATWPERGGIDGSSLGGQWQPLEVRGKSSTAGGIVPP